MDDHLNPVDIHVGMRLRQRRTLLGMSQETLGKALDLTFQQIQKYERGANRMGASRLHQMSKVLDVPIAWFFENMPYAPASRAGFSDNEQAPLEVVRDCRSRAAPGGGTDVGATPVPENNLTVGCAIGLQVAIIRVCRQRRSASARTTPSCARC